MKVILMMAITADGFIGQNSDHLTNWTSTSDKMKFKEVTTQAGCLVMGRKTYDTIGRPLPNRLTYVITKYPEIYTSIPHTVQFTNESPEKIIEHAKKLGYTEIIIAGGSQINSLFLNNSCITDIYLTIEPVLFGNGITIFQNQPPELVLSLENHEVLNENTLFIHYTVNYGNTDKK